MANVRLSPFIIPKLKYKYFESNPLISWKDILIDPVIKDSCCFLTATVYIFTTALLTHSSAESVPLETNVSFRLLALKSRVTHPSRTEKVV